MNTNTGRRRTSRKTTGRLARNRGCALRAWASALVVLAAACGSEEAPKPDASPAPATPGTASVGPAERPRRIVSLSPIASRFVAEIGAPHLLVAVDGGSQALPGFAHLPRARLADASTFDPDWVLVPELPAKGDRADAARAGSDAEWIEFAPHDLDDVFELCRRLGSRLVGTTAATLFERRIARPLASIGGSAPATGRPRVVAVVELSPLRWAGGHSFETDLIEIAGGTSVTHGGDEERVEPTPELWRASAPDLVLVTSKAELGADERAAARTAIPDRYRVAYFAFDRDSFWLGEPARDAERLRRLIASADPDRSSLYSDAADENRGLPESIP